MSNKHQIQANSIIGRPMDADFWKHTAAKTICTVFDRMTNDLDISDDDASEIIVAIWNAACEEYGE